MPSPFEDTFTSLRISAAFPRICPGSSHDRGLDGFFTPEAQSLTVFGQRVLVV